MNNCVRRFQKISTLDAHAASADRTHEFRHPCFQRNSEHLLVNIKRVCKKAGSPCACVRRGAPFLRLLVQLLLLPTSSAAEHAVWRCSGTRIG